MTAVTQTQKIDFLEQAKISYITYKIKEALPHFRTMTMSVPNARKKFEDTVLSA